MTEKTSKKNKIDMALFESFINEFRTETDRAAVILGAAKLDELLRQILQAYLLTVPSGRDELLSQENALGTFSSKINISYRLGLIDAEFSRALHIVRKIRNFFAHEISGCSLTSGPQRNRVSELCSEYKQYSLYEEMRNYFFKGKTGSEIDFRVSLAIMTARLDYFRYDVRELHNPGTMPFINSSWELLDEEQE